MSSYGGILTAMLTVPRVTIPIDSLADLVAQNDLPWRLEAGSMTPRFLMESGEPVRQRVVTGASGTFPDCWSARQSIVDGEFVAICDETTMKKAMAWDFSTTGECHLYIAKEKVYSSAWMAVAFKRNSSFLARANGIIRVLKEAGLVDHWLGQEIVSTPQCLRSPTLDRQEGVAPLNLETLLGPLLVLAAGLSFATLAFVGELLMTGRS
ncbi:uncharacterized protein LOC135089254 [Scylla paramamosain]|uniref:uncharacterized protein LOC135089254 n=1 Tax=Scylla paramamosain TaxID=85552 RepID=UPI0030836056